MRFFFDNCIAPQLARVMLALGEQTLHLRDQFQPDTDDVDWLAWVGEQRLVLVTTDLNIMAKRAEYSALSDAGVVAFFLAKGFHNRSLIAQAEHLCKVWPGIKAAAVIARPGTAHEVQENGKVKVWTKDRSRSKRQNLREESSDAISSEEGR